VRCADIWKATICNHARLLLRPWIVPSADARHWRDNRTGRALAELLRVLRPLRTSQRDLDTALVSLAGAHSSQYELDIYSIAMRVQVHSQHSNNRRNRAGTYTLLMRQSSAQRLGDLQRVGCRTESAAQMI
jgi:hypothetical protein